MKLSNTAIRELSAKYRSVLKKCFLINMGIFCVVAGANASTIITNKTWDMSNENQNTEAHEIFSKDADVVIGNGMDTTVTAQISSNENIENTSFPLGEGDDDNETMNSLTIKAGSTFKEETIGHYEQEEGEWLESPRKGYIGMNIKNLILEEGATLSLSATGDNQDSPYSGNHAADIGDVETAVLKGTINLHNSRIEGDMDNPNHKINLEGANVTMTGDFANMESGKITISDSSINASVLDHGFVSTQEFDISDSTINLDREAHLISADALIIKNSIITLNGGSRSNTSVTPGSFLYGDAINLNGTSLTTKGQNYLFATKVGGINLEKQGTQNTVVNVNKDSVLSVYKLENSISTMDDTFDEGHDTVSNIIGEFADALGTEVGKLTVKDGVKLNVSGELQSDLEVQGGEVTVDSGYGIISQGAAGVIISGGKVTAQNGYEDDAGEVHMGNNIKATNDISISGGEIALSNKAAMISQEGDINISGGKITLDNDAEIWSMDTSKKTTISGDAEITLINDSDIAPEGSLEINGGKITATESEVGSIGEFVMNAGELNLNNAAFGSEGTEVEQGDDSAHRDGKVTITGGVINVAGVSSIADETKAPTFSDKLNVLMGKDMTMSGGILNVAKDALLSFRNGYTDESYNEVSTLKLTGGTINLAGTIDGHLVGDQNDKNNSGILNLLSDTADITETAHWLNVNVLADATFIGDDILTHDTTIGNSEKTVTLTIDGDVEDHTNAQMDDLTINNGSTVIAKTTTATYPTDACELTSPTTHGVNINLANLTVAEGAALTLEGNGNHSVDVTLSGEGKLSGNINLTNGRIEGNDMDEEPDPTITIDKATVAMSDMSNIEAGGKVNIKDSTVTMNTDDHGLVSGTKLSIDNSTINANRASHVIGLNVFNGENGGKGELDITNSSTLNMTGTAIAGGDKVIIDNSTVNVKGTNYILSHEDAVALQNGSTLNIDADKSLSVLAGKDINDVDDEAYPTIIEAYQALNPDKGTLSVDSTSSIINKGTLNANVVNAGTMQTLLQNVNGSITNNGSLTILDSVVEKDVSGNGKIYLTDSATLKLGNNLSLFSTASSVNLGKNSTIDLQNGTALNTTLNNLMLAADDTVNMKLDWGDSLSVSGKDLLGSINLASIDLSQTQGDSIDESYTFVSNNLKEKVLLTDAVNLITTDTSNNWVKYNSITGKLTSGLANSTTDLISGSEDGDVINTSVEHDIELGKTESVSVKGTVSIESNGNTIGGAGAKIEDNATLVVRNGNVKGIETNEKGAFTVNAGGHVKISANNADVDISDSKTNNGTEHNAIYLQDNGTDIAKATIEASGNYKISIKDDIKSSSRDNLVDFFGKIDFSGYFDPATAVVNAGTTLTRSGYDDDIMYQLEKDGTLVYTSDKYLYDDLRHGTGKEYSKNHLVFNGGSLDIANGQATDIRLASLTLSKGTISSMNADVDLANKKMDTLNADTVSVEADAKLKVSKLNLLSDAAEKQTNVVFTEDENLMKAVSYTGAQGISYSPKYTYDVTYDSTNGQFQFTRKGGNEGLNPSLFSSSTVSQTVGLLQSSINSVAFDGLNGNNTTVVGKAAGDVPSGNTWVKFVGFDDDVDFDSFKTVDNEMYSLIGGMSTNNIRIGSADMKLGFYAGYLNGEQKYTDNKIEQEGGYLGLSTSLTKNNIVLDGTINGGFMRNEAKNTFGTDKYNTYWTGIGIKAGYNYNLAPTWTLQPNVYAGYTLVDTEDYTSKSSVHIENDKTHLFEVAPGFKLSKDFKDSWKGYVQAKYAVLSDKGGDVNADDLALPNISADNYAEYGIGVEKTFINDWGMSLTANRRDGGRQGWNGSVELKYNF